MMNNEFHLETLIIGPLQTNCYILWNENSKKAFVIDPGGLAKSVLTKIGELNLTLEKIIITHGHWDHFIGNRGLKKHFPDAKILIHEQDASMLPDADKNMSISFLGKSIFSPPADILLKDNDSIELTDNLILKVLHTPGHSPGSICLHCPQQNILFAGDLIFADGGVGRTDLPRSSHSDLIASINRIFRTIPDETIILPGHGPQTTIEREKQIHQIR